jgi:hypothetical protein
MISLACRPVMHGAQQGLIVAGERARSRQVNDSYIAARLSGIDHRLPEWLN